MNPDLLTPTNPSIFDNQGFSLIELLCVLLISSLLCALAGYSFKQLWAAHHINAQAQILTQTLKTAQLMAIYSGQTVHVCADLACMIPWRNELFILTENGSVLLQAPLSDDNPIQIQAFPLQIQNAFIFLDSGKTAYQNASIIICHPKVSLGKKLVINPAGRIRPEPFEDCPV